MAYIVLGIPSYDEKVPSHVIPPIMNLARKNTVHYIPVSASLLAFSHNLLFSQARRVAHADYYINLHSDIVPDPDALVQLLEICQEYNADVVSVVAPIKDGRGVTSTGKGKADDDWHPVSRFTMREIMAMPETFGQEQVDPDVLMINTGLMIFNMRRPFVKDVVFTIKDKIIVDTEGRPHPIIIPEDWGLSHDLYRMGAKVYATRKPGLVHMGRQGFPNNSAWGDWEHDKGDTSFSVSVEQEAPQPAE